MTASNPTTALERDPVCGMNVSPASAKHVHEHAGKKYYFCCASCVEKFKAHPQEYLNKPAAFSSNLVMLGMPAPAKSSPSPHPAGAHKITLRPAPKPTPPASPAYVCPMCPEVRESKPGACPSCGMALEPEVPLSTTRTEYTCPMHPEIVRAEPGACPICGMALEPRTMTAAAEENPELRDMTRRFWVGVALTAPLLAIAMGSMLWPHRFMGALSVNGIRLNLPWLEFALSTPVVLWCGLPFFQRFWTSLVNRSPNMFTLIGLGTGVAYSYSVVATFAPRIFPQSLRGMGGYPDVYFEAAAACRHHHAGLARSGDGTPSPQPHQRRHSSAPRSEPENGAPRGRRGGWRGYRERYSARTGEAGRPPACASGRKSSRRWRASRRSQRHR